MLTREQYDNTTALIAALRSGEYTQTTGVLARVNGKESNCCLGVGCRLAGLSGEVVADNAIMFAFGDNSYEAMPDVRWFENRYGIDVRMQQDLADLNDHHSDFDHIANYIERWLNEQSVNIEQTSNKE